MTEKYWHICPTQVLDQNKYRGKGRPRKTDYKILRAENFLLMPPVKITIVDSDGDNWNYKITQKYGN